MSETRRPRVERTGGHHMKRTTATALTVLLATLALLAAACGSSPPDPTATPEPTATPSAAPPADTPTPTETPTPSATSTAAAVTDSDGPSGAYDVDRLADRALDFLTAFTNDLSPRASGTDEERAAADFLTRLFEDLGYDTSVQEFSFEVAGASATLSSGEGEATQVPAVRMYLTAMGEAIGDLVYIDLALEDDIPTEGLDGKVALVRRGDIRFEEKIRRVTEAGAIGAIVYNNESGLFGGRLETQARIPVVTTSKETGEEILALMEDGDVQAAIAVTNEYLPSPERHRGEAGPRRQGRRGGRTLRYRAGRAGRERQRLRYRVHRDGSRRDRRIRLSLHHSHHRVRSGGARPARQRTLRPVAERRGEGVHRRHAELRRAGRERHSRRDGRLGAPNHCG